MHKSNPFKQFTQWYQSAVKAKVMQPDAMVLATASKNAQPSARVVLFKGIDKTGIRFFTNYESDKARNLNENPRVALVFYWQAQGRQIRIEGKVAKLTEKESDIYWNSRPRESRLSALVSRQSRMIPGRKFLERRLVKLTKEFEGKEIPRPKNWGGYRVIPTRFEFWLLGDYRLHDRFLYSKKKNKWVLTCLAP